MNPLRDAEQVVEYYRNLNLEISAIVNSDDPKEVLINGMPVNAAAILMILSKPGMTWDAKVKCLANLGNIMNHEVEAVLSNFSEMRTVREELFRKWLQIGRPDTHIFRG